MIIKGLEERREVLDDQIFVIYIGGMIEDMITCH